MIHGLDASLELEYVLAVPAERAAELKAELMRSGMPDSQIKVVQPGQSDRASGGNRQRGDRRYRRFMPSHVRLGTYAGGLYDVMMRRRTAPECRETVWISLAADRGTCDSRQHAPGNDEDGDGSDNGRDTLTVRRCGCDAAGCTDRRNALRKCLAEQTTETGRGHDPATTCVYERMAHALSGTPRDDRRRDSDDCNDDNDDGDDDGDGEDSDDGDDERIPPVGRDRCGPPTANARSQSPTDAADVAGTSGPRHPKMCTPSPDHPDRDHGPFRANVTVQTDGTPSGADGDHTTRDPGTTAGQSRDVAPRSPGFAAPVTPRTPARRGLFGRLKFWRTTKSPKPI